MSRNISLLPNIKALKDAVRTALQKSERFRAWQSGELSDLGSAPEEAWPTFSEYELIELQARAFAQQLGQPVAGLEKLEAYIARYSGNVRHAYEDRALPVDPDDSVSTHKRLLAAEAAATSIWLRHVLDFLNLLENASHSIGSASTGEPFTSGGQVTSRTILFASATPTDSDRLETDAEVREIRDELQKSENRSAFRLETRGACRPTDFVRDLLNIKPQIVHFSGHGTNSGELYFLDEKGSGRPASSVAVGDLFRECAHFVQCVILNACYSEVQARAIRSHIPKVIGMRTAIKDGSAIRFSKAFYLGLASCGDEAQAFRVAVATMNLEGLSDAYVPIMV